MLACFFWWVGMDVSARWWTHRCLKRQARNTSRQKVFAGLLSFLFRLPTGPVTVAGDYLSPLPVTPRGNSYILLFADCFSRRANMYAGAAAK